MTAELVIRKLRSVGYQIRTDGQDILLTSDHEPHDTELVTNLLAELRKCKAEAVNILKMGKTFISTVKSQPQVDVKLSWPPALQSLMDWFLIQEAPAEPFLLEPHLRVLDPGKFFESLRREIETGPRGPRARMGTLQSDLRKLKAYLN